jgi:hypothetical protein
MPNDASLRRSMAGSANRHCGGEQNAEPNGDFSLEYRARRSDLLREKHKMNFSKRLFPGHDGPFGVSRANLPRVEERAK